MTETESSFTKIIYVEGKLSALQILYKEYLEAQLRGVKNIPTSELLKVIRTIILNLGGDT
jgi:hypothetical protein